MNKNDRARHSIAMGRKYPYSGRGLKTADSAKIAALGIMADLSDRRGIKWGLEGIDADVRSDIVESLAAIIRQAYAMAPHPFNDEPKEAP